MRSRLIVLFALLGGIFGAEAQYGYGYGGYGNGGYYGRNAIPQAETPAKKPEPKTAEEIVEDAMPQIIEAAALNDFEAAVVSATLTKYVQQRIELRILELTPEQTREALENIEQAERAELEQGLPPEKFEAMMALKENGYDAKRFKKKEKRKKKSKS
ncbi:hypothetical protein OZ410_12040 [Robiginitalea sp. M366]|uniref:hypothetical protein n=1 Tax=Robiginitalea aestuariiviva TaxID=3036903 RepID=UPI00240D292E|nr:hypothetical protein [Robiginitalea aestuariiviva]MDG1573051.1 hypothetical protein [Robiginitalea aestuariiviva]